jgi:hypothetical protein
VTEATSTHWILSPARGANVVISACQKLEQLIAGSSVTIHEHG